MTIAAFHKVQGTVLKIYSCDRDKPRAIYNFQEIGFSKNVAKALVSAFITLHGANSIESQRAAWIKIKHFGSFAELTFGTPAKLPSDCMKGFDKWMELKGQSGGVIGATLSIVIRLLQWCTRNAPAVVHPKIQMVRLSYTSNAKSRKPQENIPDELFLRKILEACYAEIEMTEKRISEIRSLVKQGGNEFSELLRDLLKYGDGILPNQERVLKLPRGRAIMTRLKLHGGFRSINGQFYLTIRDIFPFYMAILIQTSGNPQSLLDAQQDCIVDVPMRSDLERIIWDKPRAGREQTADFSKHKEWAAPNIVRRLKLLNAEFRSLASPHQADKLFLCKTYYGRITQPSWQAIHGNFLEFRKVHGFPKFDLRSVRSAGAKLHHQAARSLVAAQQRLQHVSVDTTQIYTPLKDIRFVHDKTILGFQGLLISEAQKIGSHAAASCKSDSRNPLAERETETLFGFECKDPYGGIAPASRKGEACLHFHQCATCPGALIVVDDAACVAKLLRTHEHLLRERDRAMREGWSRRFEMQYAPTLAILQRDILPSLSNKILEQARLIPWQPLPRLE